ncbi:MAG TPA: ATP-binding protein, partial [Flavobacteriales bacterium]|nr:ATP-binding protein [Flavobacteriales bacterium]
VMQGYRSIEASKAKEQMAALKLREEELGISESINELDEIIGSMAEGSSRTAEIVRGLRNFSRLDEDDLKPTDLNEGIRSTLTLLGPQVKDHVTISLDLMELPAVECYPGKLNQVFMNVITNAIHATKAMDGDRKPLIQISSHCTAGHAIICIRDNGSGMNAEVKTRIFDPFFTTKPVGEGTGLGLAIVYGIIEDHQGSISVESEVGEGSVFTIQIPLLHEKLIQLRA